MSIPCRSISLACFNQFCMPSSAWSLAHVHWLVCSCHVEWEIPGCTGWVREQAALLPSLDESGCSHSHCKGRRRMSRPSPGSRELCSTCPHTSLPEHGWPYPARAVPLCTSGIAIPWGEGSDFTAQQPPKPLPLVLYLRSKQLLQRMSEPSHSKHRQMSLLFWRWDAPG